MTDVRTPKRPETADIKTRLAEQAKVANDVAEALSQAMDAASKSYMDMDRDVDDALVHAFNLAWDHARALEKMLKDFPDSGAESPA